MKWRTSGEIVSLPIDFKVNDQFVIPDEGSIRVTLRDGQGAILPGCDHLEVSEASAPLSLSDTTPPILKVPASINTLVAEAAMGTRFVTVDYTVGGSPATLATNYRIVPFCPITATPAQVRARWGVEYHELPDDDIDLIEAFYTVRRTQPRVQEALLSGTLASVAANNVVELTAALLVAPSMAARVLKSEKQANAGFERQAVNYAEVKQALEGELNIQIATMMAELGAASTVTLAPMFMKITPTDPITNA